MPEVQTDAVVVAAAVKGDRAAFSELVRRHQGTVYRIVLRILRDPGESNDAAQEAFLKAFRNLASFDVTRPFAPWIYRIARNQALDVARHKGVSPEELERPDPDDDEGAAGAVGRDVADPDAESALDRIEAAELKLRIGGALAKLDPKYREVIELYHYEQLTYDEIAETLGIPIGTVMTRIHRGRGKLAETLKSLGPQGPKPDARRNAGRTGAA
jgi:RNA polymerase sigma-70 factor (ECF subfamily)